VLVGGGREKRLFQRIRRVHRRQLSALREARGFSPDGDGDGPTGQAQQQTLVLSKAVRVGYPAPAEDPGDEKPAEYLCARRGNFDSLLAQRAPDEPAR